ncbi:MAG: VPLPA-CTERM sorting domain-containing protein, partial [Burkholderiales bacterium]
LNGNLASNRVAGLGGTINSTWANGDTLWLRWAEVNDNGSDHGLAIDNFSLTAGTAVPSAVPLPAAAWLLGAGLGALGWTGRRRARG